MVQIGTQVLRIVGLSSNLPVSDLGHPATLIITTLATLGLCAVAKGEFVHAPQQLQRDQGYILLDLNLERKVSEIVIASVSRLRSSRKVRYSGDIVLGPYDPGRHLILLPLREGQYGWRHTSIPHFDLPYRVDKSDDERWRFTVEEDSISYIGQLVVREERGSNSASVSLVNRIAMTGEEIASAFPTEFELYSLRYGGILRDAFFEANYPAREQSH